MNEKTILAQSFEQLPDNAVAELKEKFDNSNNSIKAIIFFASSQYNSAELITAMNKSFPNVPVFGCSTAGEIISCDGNRRMGIGSVVAIALTDMIIEDIKIEVLDRISHDIDLQPVVQSFEDHFSAPLYSLDPSKYFGLIYMDGVSNKEEIILDEIGDYTNIGFMGGSASDYLKYEKTIVYANGNYYENGAVLAIVKSKVPFGFEKVQSFVDTGHKVIATKVDVPNRIVYEFNNRPAAEVLSEIINLPINQFTNNTYSEYSLGLFIEGQPYMRSINRVMDDLSLKLACSVREGMQLSVLQSSDIISDTRDKWKQIGKKYNSISTVIIANCVLRSFELNSKEQMQDYVDIFANEKLIGFCSYGEAFIGHMNHSTTFLILE